MDFHPSRRTGVAAFVIAPLYILAAGQVPATRPAVPKDSPRAAVMARFEARRKGDVGRVRDLTFYGPGDHRAFATAAAEAAIAMTDFNGALSQMFGADTVRPYDHFPDNDTVASATETIQGNYAIVDVRSGPAAQKFLMVRVNSRWLFDNAAQANGPGTGEQPTRGMIALTAAVKGATIDVRAGHFSTVADAVSERDKRVLRAIQSELPRK